MDLSELNNLDMHTVSDSLNWENSSFDNELITLSRFLFLFILISCLIFLFINSLTIIHYSRKVVNACVSITTNEEEIEKYLIKYPKIRDNPYIKRINFFESLYKFTINTITLTLITYTLTNIKTYGVLDYWIIAFQISPLLLITLSSLFTNLYITNYRNEIKSIYDNQLKQSF